MSCNRCKLRLNRIAELEARIDGMVRAFDAVNKECSLLEEEAFALGWCYATADAKRGHRTQDHVITEYRKWKHHFSEPNHKFPNCLIWVGDNERSV